MIQKVKSWKGREKKGVAGRRVVEGSNCRYC